jgi:hypothetical protein
LRREVTVNDHRPANESGWLPLVSEAHYPSPVTAPQHPTPERVARSPRYERIGEPLEEQNPAQLQDSSDTPTTSQQSKRDIDKHDDDDEAHQKTD